jgi:hypothetical protein
MPKSPLPSWLDSYLPLPINREHYYAIGHVAAMWNAVETEIQWLLWAVFGLTEQTGKPLTAAARLDTHLASMKLMAEARSLSINHKDEIAVIIAETTRLHDKRNLLVHANWVIDDWSKPPRTHSLRKKDQGKSQPFTASEIDAIGHLEKWALPSTAQIRFKVLIL